MTGEVEIPCLADGLAPHPEAIRFDKSLRCAATIKLAQHADGRWMWGIDYRCGWAGGGYWPGPKWGKFAATRTAAINRAAEEIDRRIERCDAHVEASKIRAWIESITPRQPDLFF